MITITVERQGDMFCATKTDEMGMIARGFGDTEEEARAVAESKPLRIDYDD